MPKLKSDLLAEMKEAREAQDMEAYNTAMTEYIDLVASGSAEEKLQDTLKMVDQNIMISRGKRILTSEEKKFYAALTDAVRSDNFRNAISSTDVIIPETVISTVFDDLTVDHPIFSHIDIKVVNAKVKVIFAKAGAANKAVWGKVDAKITKELEGSFEEMEVYQKKISAFIPLPLYLLDLGYEYIDRFVRTILSESMLNGFEDAIINGVTSESPIGMVADFSKNATTNSTTGVTTYVKQTATAVTELTAEGLKNVIKKLTVTRNGLPRSLGSLFMVINPSDYYTLIKPAISVQNSLGDFVDRLPYAITFVPSVYCEAGTAILGLDGQYALGIGTAYTGKIEYSDEYQFLDDKRTYKIKAYGEGRPKDGNSFVLLNISGLKRPPLQILDVTPAKASS